MYKDITTPLTDEVIKDLKAGDRLLISGFIYTARDAAHKRMVDLIAQGKELPIEIKGQILYYVGPTPAKEGQIIGAAGPTTASRMDSTTEPLLKAGLKGTIGKGGRGKEIAKLFAKYGAVHMVAIGGAGAYLSKRIKSVSVVAYPELGTEAIHKMEFDKFPVIVINDINGRDFYHEAQAQYST